MKLDKLEAKLLRAARTHTPSDAVPYAFEKRVRAQLSSRTTADPWHSWATALWRAVAPCVGIMLLLAAWSYAGPDYATADPNTLPEDLEQAVLAVVDADDSAENVW
jgi:hypothetical protein